MANTQRVWKSVRYGVSNGLDTAYWRFLGVGTTLDIFQNIIFIPYFQYGVLVFSGYDVLSFIPLWSLMLFDVIKDKESFYAYIEAMNFLLQGIPNDIYNSVDACQDAKAMWNHVKRLMQGTNLSEQERHSRLMNEFDKFFVEAGESLESVYERFSTLMNNMQRNKLLPGSIAVNTKFLNSLQPKLSKYVTMAPKRAARNHDPLALVANTYASPSYSRSSQSYYVTHPPSVHDYDDDYQGEVQGDDQEDKLSTAMMLLARAITQHFSTSTNNRLCTSSNTSNQAVIQNGRVDIQSKNVGCARNGSRNSRRIAGNEGNYVGNGFVQKNDGNAENVQRNPRTTANSGKTPTVQCYNCNEKGHYARECSKPRVRDSKYFREQMLLATKDEAGIHLDEEENDFMLMSAFGDDQLEELNASVIIMARIQPTKNDSDAEPTYDSDFVCEVNDSHVDIINGLLSKSDQE
ncbi:integrase, catalytic region, zinc finger, CCHC-type containing protein [Tanacetum coccineum]